MRIPGARTVRRVAGRVRQRFDRAPIILLYHRIAHLDDDPWSIAVTPEHFAEHLEVLRQRYLPVSLADLVERQRERRLPRGGVVLTFDDGYLDNLDCAKPLLERFECPATFFVATGSLEGTREYWWDELERLVVQPGGLPRELALRIDETVHRWNLHETTRDSLLQSVYWLLRPLQDHTQQNVLQQLRAFRGVEPACRPTHRTITREDVAGLAGDPLVEVGSHTVTHPLLASLPDSLQRQEIEGSKRLLEELLGKPTCSFAYPHGGADDFNATSVSLVREAGYDRACAAYGGVIRSSSDRFRLPRFDVPDCDGEAFARRLERLFE
jgi:peptidoglycan/xylan/chitin deacetylase (PgdA/CDA1 family)